MTIAQTSLESIRELMEEVKLDLARAGIPSRQLRIRSGKHRIDACSRAFDWLHDLSLSDELIKYTGIRALRTEELWERYELFEIEGLQEQILLEEAAQNLRARWRRRRPAMFNSDLKRTRND